MEARGGEGGGGSDATLLSRGPADNLVFFDLLSLFSRNVMTSWDLL